MSARVTHLPRVPDDYARICIASAQPPGSPAEHAGLIWRLCAAMPAVHPALELHHFGRGSRGVGCLTKESQLKTLVERDPSQVRLVGPLDGPRFVDLLTSAEPISPGAPGRWTELRFSNLGGNVAEVARAALLLAVEILSADWGVVEAVGWPRGACADRMLPQAGWLTFVSDAYALAPAAPGVSMAKVQGGTLLGSSTEPAFDPVIHRAVEDQLRRSSPAGGGTEANPTGGGTATWLPSEVASRPAAYFDRPEVTEHAPYPSTAVSPPMFEPLAALGQTAPLGASAQGPVLPFAPGLRGVGGQAVPPARPLEPSDEIGQTRGLESAMPLAETAPVGARAETGSSLPFDLEDPSGVTIPRYAELFVELERSTVSRATILEHYGMGEAELTALQARYQQRFKADLKSFRRWSTLVSQLRKQRSGG